MAASLPVRRRIVQATGIGVAAGCMGTWFEMSHGVVCIPVLSLPPLALPQQVAVGSTVFGVAARQLVSAVFYGLDPDNDLTADDALEELIDTNAAIGLATSGSIAAVWGAGLSRSIASAKLKRINGAFMIGLAVFINWREQQAQGAKARKEAAQKAGLLTEDGKPVQDAVPAPASSVPSLKPMGAKEARAASLAAMMPQGEPAPQWVRYGVLGSVSGLILGLFGVGPAWMVAPVMMNLQKADRAASGTKAAELSNLDSEAAFGGDERTRRTCCVGMIAPCLVSAARHFQLGHVPNAGTIALPLALGAIAGSAITGMQLDDTPADEDHRLGLSILLLAWGGWSLFRPT
eukprot:TRINITY_DN22237_c0_g1_i1.p1 TRINITY_DN22237_c0_g1~~TRINITY_DN22237_c0_g1_i1.p1  ORF type:complete len:364 (+),score=72.99 TRINITY_DN22237_c0_g1_i1:53-1093(+)